MAQLNILHIFQALSLGGAARSAIALAKYARRLGLAQQHAVVALSQFTTDAVACDLARQHGMEVVVQPDRSVLAAAIDRADAVQVHFWNTPELYEFLRADWPPMRLLLWLKVVGDRAPHVLTPALVDFADFVLATTPLTLELPVLQRLDAETRSRKTGVIPGIADFDRLAGLQPKPHATFNVGYIGTVDFAKMHPRYGPMHAAIAIPSLRVMVCGDPNPAVVQQVRAAGIGDRVEFRGQVENIADVLAELDVFGYPLCEDTYATSEKSLQEAMYAGVPPVVFPHGGVRTLVRHNETGLTVRSEAEYCQAIEFLYRNPAERRRLGENARRYARETFAPERAIERMAAIYDRLLALPKRARSWPTQPQSGAERFIDSLGEAAPQFARSRFARDPSQQLDADRAIAQSSSVLCTPYGGGIFHYRNRNDRDAWLRLWSGLVLNARGDRAGATSEWQAAIALGCESWLVWWYLAETAAVKGDRAAAAAALAEVLEVAPEFAPARELWTAVRAESGSHRVLPDLQATATTSTAREKSASPIAPKEPKLAIAPDYFQDFTYSKVSHFQQFRKFGPYQSLQVETCDLKAYQDLLVYTFIVENLPPGSKLLEVGGGDSRVIAALKKDYECWNLDKFEGSGNGLTQIPPVDGYRLVLDYAGNFNSELPESYFDCVFSISTLEHVPDDRETFEAIHRDLERLLAPGGFSLHCLDVVLRSDSVWCKGILPYFFEQCDPQNTWVPFSEARRDPDLYGLSESTYRLRWQHVTQKSYAEFGKPISYNILWQKILAQKPPSPKTHGDRSEVFRATRSPILLQQSSLPKISIVTPSLNQAEFLEACIDSVLSQGYPNLEYAIFDGGSRDGSQEIIRRYERHLTYWQSRPDGGHYAAVNAGLAGTTGTVMAWLNSDDKYHPDALFKVAAVVCDRPEIEWLTGRGTRWNLAGRMDYVAPHFVPWSRSLLLDRGWEKYGQWIQQESTFWQRSLWERAGGQLRADLRLAGDFELWLRFSRHAPLHAVDAWLGGFRAYPGQRSQAFEREYREEVERIVAAERDRVACGALPAEGPPAPPPLTIAPASLERVKQLARAGGETGDRPVQSTGSPEGANPAGATAPATTTAPEGMVLVTSLAPGAEAAQQAAVASWQALGFSVASLNCAEEVRQLRDRYPTVQFHPVARDGRETYGKPLIYVDDLLEFLRRSPSKFPVVGLVNADVRLAVPANFSGNFIDWLAREVAGSVAIASRIDTEGTTGTTGEPYDRGFDLFFFDRCLLDRLPSCPFCLGVPWWDFWLPARVLQAGIPLKRLVTPLAYHPKHPWNYDLDRWQQCGLTFAEDCDRPWFERVRPWLDRRDSSPEALRERQALQRELIALADGFLDRVRREARAIALPAESEPAVFPAIAPLPADPSRPFWSVVLPTFNKTRYLAQTLRSVLAQAPEPSVMQIEVANDCPDRAVQDELAAIARSVGGDRVAFYRHPQPDIGQTAMFNLCLSRARGQWIHLLHDDDFVLPGFYDRLRAGIERDPEVGLAFCRHFYIDEADCQRSLSPLERDAPGILDNWLDRIGTSQRIQPSSVVVRRSAYETVGGFCPQARSAADWEMWQRVSARFPVWYEPEPLAAYRLHSLSWSTRLIRTGGNIADTRAAIAVARSYLPPELSDRALEHYARYALSEARSLLQRGDREAAIAQCREGLECARTEASRAALAACQREAEAVPPSPAPAPTVFAAEMPEPMNAPTPNAPVPNAPVPNAPMPNAPMPNALAPLASASPPAAAGSPSVLFGAPSGAGSGDGAAIARTALEALARYQQAPEDEAALAALRSARQALAEAWRSLGAADLEAAWGGPLGQAQRALRESDLRYEGLTAEERLRADDLKRAIAAGPQAPDYWPSLLAAMLYCYPHQLPLRYDGLAVPDWFLGGYALFCQEAPLMFREMGEVERYAEHLCAWTDQVYRTIQSAPQHSATRELAKLAAYRGIYTPLYFSRQTRVQVYRQRAAILEFALKADGAEIDWTFAPRTEGDGVAGGAGRRKIRLGVLKDHFNPQTETFSTLPAFEHLDRDRFEIILYALQTNGHPLERYCAGKADRLVALPGTLAEQVRAIRADDLDLLWIGTNVTMVPHGVTLLAVHRLARVQVMGNSAPTTTGMRSIDYYLSGSLTELLDRDRAQTHYAETLETIAGPAHCFNYGAYSPPATASFDRADWGATAATTVFASGANLNKITPELRELWARILAAVPDSVLVLYPFNPNWGRNYPAQPFARAMGAALAAQGVDPRRLVLLRPFASPEDIKVCLRQADVYLDSFPFAGVNSTADPLAVGLPPVVLEGAAFRERMGAALLRSLDLPELAAKDEAGYCDLAVRLAGDRPWRESLRSRIQTAMLRHPPFLDGPRYGTKVGAVLADWVDRWHRSRAVAAGATPSAAAGGPYCPPLAIVPAQVEELLGMLTLAGIFPDDAALYGELRRWRRRLAEAWLQIPADRWESTYQRGLGQAARAFLGSAIQRSPWEADERAFMDGIAARLRESPAAPENAPYYLVAMLYYAPGSMRVNEAESRLPGWLLQDYRAVFEPTQPQAVPAGVAAQR